jgi:hypothetical protein
MKRNGIKMIMFLMLSLISYVTVVAQTSQEEYNYLTKGYKVQIESGLDMKNGYSFTDIGEHYITTGSVIRKCNFKALFRLGDSKPCAILCIYTRSDNSFVDYLCIPTYDAPQGIWEQAFNKFKSYSDNGATALIWGFAKLSSYYSGGK